MKLLVTGNIRVSDKLIVATRVLEALRKLNMKLTDFDTIIRGTSVGPEYCMAEIAKKNLKGVTVKQFLLEDEFGIFAKHDRNEKMVAETDVAIVFQDEKDRNVQDVILCLKHKGCPFVIVTPGAGDEEEVHGC